MTKVEPMAYMWLLWCITCATFCAFIAFRYCTFTNFVVMEIGYFLWIYMGLDPWAPDTEN